MATKKSKSEEEAQEQEQEQTYKSEPKASEVPAGASVPGQLPPSVQGTSQDPNRGEQ
jgi:hypothetical protein